MCERLAVFRRPGAANPVLSGRPDGMLSIASILVARTQIVLSLLAGSTSTANPPST